MLKYLLSLWVSVSVLVAGVALAEQLSARQVLDRALESDPWGLSGARISAKLLLRDKRGTESTLQFSAISIPHEPTLSKSVIRFAAPAELKGAGFLQIQNRSLDDDRFLFLPEIKRARRVSGDLRSSSFMGTDFSYADLDRRDLREGQTTFLADAQISGVTCYGVEVRPDSKGSEYSRVEVWVRKDNYLPMRMKMYDRSDALLKTLAAEAVTKVEGRWFIAKTRMTNHRENHSTQLILEGIKPAKDIPAEEFTVQALERI